MSELSPVSDPTQLVLARIPGLLYRTQPDRVRSLVWQSGQWAQQWQPYWAKLVDLERLIAPTDRSSVRHAVEQSLTTGDPYTLSYSLMTPEGSLRPVHDQGHVIVEGDHRWLEGLITAAAPGLYQNTLLERMNEGVLVVDPQGQIVNVNSRFCQLFGYTHHEVVGRQEGEFIATEDGRSLLASKRALRQQGMADQYQVQIRCANGNIRTVLVSGTPLFDEQSRFTGTMGIITDITETAWQAQSLELLQTISHSIDTCPDLPDILATTIHQVCRITQWSFGEAWIPDRSQQVLTYMPGWVASHSALATFGEASRDLHFRRGEGLPGVIWQTQQPLWLRDLTQTTPEAFVRQGHALAVGLKSCFGVPLILPHASEDPSQQAEVLAVLVFFLETAHDQDQRLLNLITSVVSQVAMVWQRKQAEEKYRSIFENAIEGIFQTSPTGEYLSVNPALARIYGYDSPADLMSHIHDISHELYVDPTRRETFVNLLATQGSLSHFESEVYRKDGSTLWISEEARAICDSNGEIIRYEGLVQDITERRQAQSALEHSLSLLQTTLDATADGIISITMAGEILTYNHRFIELWQIPESLMTKDQGHERTEFLASLTRDPQLFLARIRELYLSDLESFDLIELQDDRIFERYSRPQLLAGHMIGRVWSYRDVTEAKKIERLKNEFVSMVSHELRTPLTSIRGSLGLLMGGVAGALSEQARSLVDIAAKNSERLVLLINDILDIDKIESGQMSFDWQPLELLPLVTQAIVANQAYADQFQITYALESLLDPEDPAILVRADSNRLMQVITNLLSNAAKFSPPHGTVTVRIKSQADRLRLEVVDHGSGISPEFHARIFQKFAQADSSSTRKKGGTGLGLSICKAIMEHMGGTIGFTSQPSVETTFYLELPIWQPLILSSIAMKEQRILVCEDDADIAHLLKLILKEGGFSVDVASTAQDVWERVGLRDPDSPCPYVAMTLDLALPDQDGISIIQELRHHPKTQQLPVVIVSATAGPDASHLQGGSIALVDWLSKPIDHDRLLSAIRRAAHTPSRPRILHVEDDPDILHVIAMIVGDVADVVAATNMQQAIHILQQEHFDLILLDWSLPDGSGSDLLSHINSHLQSPTPVVVFSATDIAHNTGQKVAAALIKSQTSNQKLVDTIQRLINTRGTNGDETGLPQ